MRKSGLHKQISSIFDGVPVPQPQEADNRSAGMTEPTNSLPQGIAAADAGSVAPAAPTAASSLMQRMTADPSDLPQASQSEPAPEAPSVRPMPLAKTKAMIRSKPKTGFSKQIQKIFLGSQETSLDSRQKKSAVLVGILSVVFGVVLFVSLGGVGSPQPAAAQEESGEQTVSSQTAEKTVYNWKMPNPLPQDLRNATAPAASVAAAQSKEDSTDPTGSAAAAGGLVVRGIVFSKNSPSAIINGHILGEGEIINGVKLVKITKETVEFEADGKRWTQTVQR